MSHLRLKCTKFQTHGPDPLGSMQSFPRGLAGFRGLPLNKGNGGEGKEVERYRVRGREQSRRGWSHVSEVFRYE